MKPQNFYFLFLDYGKWNSNCGKNAKLDEIHTIGCQNISEPFENTIINSIIQALAHMLSTIFLILIGMIFAYLRNQNIKKNANSEQNCTDIPMIETPILDHTLQQTSIINVASDADSERDSIT